MATSQLWTKEQVRLAFHLYCQIPFGKIHGRNPQIITLAQAIVRTADAVAMKMLNIASLDPRVKARGLAGLGNASALDRQVWAEFHENWDKLSLQTEEHRLAMGGASVDDELEFAGAEDFTGEVRLALRRERLRQNVFRQRILSGYQDRCCMSGLSDTHLLVASHIVPWSKDEKNRINPANGLCLSAIHDRAFDKGLITLSDDLTIIVSDELKCRNDLFLQTTFLPLEGQHIEFPERFMPDAPFIARHRAEEFVDNRSAVK